MRGQLAPCALAGSTVRSGRSGPPPSPRGLGELLGRGAGREPMVMRAGKSKHRPPGLRQVHRRFRRPQPAKTRRVAGGGCGTRDPARRSGPPRLPERPSPRRPRGHSPPKPCRRVLASRGLGGPGLEDKPGLNVLRPPGGAGSGLPRCAWPRAACGEADVGSAQRAPRPSASSAPPAARPSCPARPARRTLTAPGRAVSPSPAPWPGFSGRERVTAAPPRTRPLAAAAPIPGGLRGGRCLLPPTPAVGGASRGRGFGSGDPGRAWGR